MSHIFHFSEQNPPPRHCALHKLGSAPQRILLLGALLFCFYLLLLPSVARAASEGGVIFPHTVWLENQALSLRGTFLLRWMKILKIYAVALYAPDSIPSSELLADHAKQLELRYFISIKADELAQSCQTMMQRNLSKKQYHRLQNRLQQANAVFKDVHPGDRYTISYAPTQGTTIAFNGQELIVVGGADFAQAYFSMWLGQHPIDTSMRQELLQLQTP